MMKQNHLPDAFGTHYWTNMQSVECKIQWFNQMLSKSLVDIVHKSFLDELGVWVYAIHWEMNFRKDDSDS